MGKCTFLEYQWSTEIFRWEPNSGLRCGGVGKNTTHWGDIPAEEEGDVVVTEMSKRHASKNRFKTWAAVCTAIHFLGRSVHIRRIGFSNAVSPPPLFVLSCPKVRLG